LEPSTAWGAIARTRSATATKEIAFSSNFNDIPVIQTVKSLITKHATAHGYKAIFDQGQNGTLSDQVQAVQAWITEGVPAMCILPTQPQALEQYAAAAMKKGLIWTCYGAADMTNSDGWLGFSATQSGTQVGQAVVAWINKNNPTAEVLVHTQTTLPVNKPRYQVPIDMIKKYTKATIVATQDADTEPQGLQVTQATLTAHPNLSVVVGLNDDGALGAAQAFSLVHANPAKIFISGNDGSQQGLEAVKKGGYIKGTAAVPIDKVANGVVTLNIGLINNPPKNGQKVNDIIQSVWVTQHSPEIDTLLAAFK
jgi:ABC-type sugar transport system substrate-binding protein